MPDRFDDLDDWLGDRIEPLPPPPGTFEQIRRRARRRKYGRLAAASVAGAAVIAVAAVLPSALSSTGGTAPPVAEGSRSPVNSAASVYETPYQNPEATQTAPIPLPSGNPVPPNFQPASITAVSKTLAFVIGQAGTPGHCATQYCTSVARTENAGGTWSGLPAPLAGQPDGSSGVGQIRFLEGINGWAFGPELWATHDGGLQWTHLDTHGQRVIDVETAGKRAFAIFASCAGSGTDFADQCTKFTLYSSPATANDWTPVGKATKDLELYGTSASAGLTLTYTRGYLLGPDGTLYEGPTDGGGAWHAAGRLPCAPGQAQADGSPSGALLGALSATRLILDCTQDRIIYESPNSGRSWQKMWTVPGTGAATSIAASSAASVMLSTDQGIEVLPAGRTTWRHASLTGTSPAGGFSFAGMTTPTQGLALPSDATAGSAWFTTDGGLTWTASPVQGP
jgi:hypothetical protein